jgi:hypothetical protein
MSSGGGGGVGGGNNRRKWGRGGGYRARSSPKAPSESPPNHSPEPELDGGELDPTAVMRRLMRDRFLFASMNLVGVKVDVQVRCGTVYEGLFYTATTSADYEVVIKMARIKVSFFYGLACCSCVGSWQPLIIVCLALQSLGPGQEPDDLPPGSIIRIQSCDIVQVCCLFCP